MDALFICHNYENRYNIGNQHFRMALAKRFDNAVFYGPGYQTFKQPVDEVLESVKPDVIFFMFPTRDFERQEQYTLHDYASNKATKVLYDTDAQSSIYDRCEFANRNKVDHLFLGNNYQFLDDHREMLNNSDSVHWLPFGVDTSYFRDFNRRRKKDVMFLGCTNETHYLNRVLMVAVMRRAFKDRFFFEPTNEINRHKYVETLNEYKIFTSAGDRYQGFFMKYLEVMACGCLLISQYSPCFRLLGFEHGRHLIQYNTYNELTERVDHYLRHNAERARIAEIGRNFVLRKHTWKHRVDEMMEILNG